MKINPLNAIDFYKTDHRRQYPEGTTKAIKTWLHNAECIADLINRLRCDRIFIY